MTNELMEALKKDISDELYELIKDSDEYPIELGDASDEVLLEAEEKDILTYEGRESFWRDELKRRGYRWEKPAKEEKLDMDAVLLSVVKEAKRPEFAQVSVYKETREKLSGLCDAFPRGFKAQAGAKLLDMAVDWLLVEGSR